MAARYAAGVVGILGGGAGLLGAYEYSTVSEYTNKEAAAKVHFTCYSSVNLTGFADPCEIHV